MSRFWLSPQEGSLCRSQGALVAIKIAKRARAELGSGISQPPVKLIQKRGHVGHGKLVANPSAASTGLEVLSRLLSSCWRGIASQTKSSLESLPIVAHLAAEPRQCSGFE